MSLIRVDIFYLFNLDESGNVPFMVLGTILVGHVVPMRAVHLVFNGK